MTVQVESCPSCGASLRIPENVARFTCPYCSASIAIKHSGADVSLALANAINTTAAGTQAAIQEGTSITQSELRRMQLTQQLSQMELQLSNVRAEIRSIQRSEMTRVSKAQLSDLKSEERALIASIQNIKVILSPVAQTAPPAMRMPAAGSGASDSRGIVWLLFSFSGTATAGQYWTAAGIVLVAMLVLSGLAAAVGITEDNPLFGLFGLGFLWIYLAVGTKRCRELGKSPWWLSIILIPVIGLFWQFYELGFRSTRV